MRPNAESFPFQVLLRDAHRSRVAVTPALAEHILAFYNRRNRSVKQTTVDKFVRDMLDGRWKYNGEPMIFDTNGDLLSGQHRLLAVIKSGVTIFTDMKFGVNPDVRDTVDTGTARRPGDVVQLVTGDKSAAFKTKVVNGIRKIVNRRRDGLSAGLALEMMDDFSAGLKIVADLVKGKSLWGRGPAAAAFALAGTAYPTRTRELLEGLVSGTTPSPAAQALHSYGLSGFGTDKEDAIADKILYGIYRHLQGSETVDRLQTRRHDDVVQFFVERLEKKGVNLTGVSTIADRIGAQQPSV